MADDDRQRGRLLSRREILALIGTTGVVVLGHRFASAELIAMDTDRPVPSCVVRPEQTAGPYFVDERLNRSDIRSDPTTGAVKTGALLDLTFRVSRIDRAGCTPLAGAQVDVWHCDALGIYSDVEDPGFTTTGQKFLRGYQVTDGSGRAAFTTIYPGWYAGRTVHIHFKIRAKGPSNVAHEFVSQLYFDERLTDAVHSRPPYAGKGERDTRNSDDSIYRDGGEQLVLTVANRGNAYAATFDIALQMT